MARTKVLAAVGVLAAMGITVYLLVNTQSRYFEIRSFTDDASQLDEGTAVRLNGIGIGYLDSLELTNSRNPKRKIQLTMKVENRYLARIPQDSLVNVTATNLLGGYFIDIIEGRSSQPVMPGGELATSESVEPDRLLAQMSNEFQEIQQIFGRFSNLLAYVDAGHGNFGLWRANGLSGMKGISDEGKKLADDLRNGPGTLGKWGDLQAQVQASQQRLDDLMGGLQAGQGTAGKLPALQTEFGQLQDEVRQITTSANSNQGALKRIGKVQEGFQGVADRLQTTADRIEAGRGTMGQLTVNPRVSTSLDAAGAEFQALAKELRANPLKAVRLQLHLF